MSDETKTETTTETSNEISVPPITINGVEYKGHATVRKKKGSENKYVTIVPEIPPDDVISVLTSFLGENGASLLAGAIIRELLKPAANAASSVAFTSDEEGAPQFNEDAYLKELANQFQPTSRISGGLSRQEIIERMLGIQPRLLELMKESSERQLTEEETQEFLRLHLESQKWTTMMEEKTRGAAMRKEKKQKKAKDEAVKTATATGNVGPDVPLQQPAS